MPLHDAVIGFAEVEDDGNENREAAEVFEDFEEIPAAEHEGDPLPAPVEGDEGDEPAMAKMTSPESPWSGAGTGFVMDHAQLSFRSGSEALCTRDEAAVW
jgi:hypothetical protein